MRFRRIPAINVVLLIVILGLLATLVVGMIMFVKSNDDPDDNYVESTYNASLSKLYTDSLSRTFLSELGKLEVKVYDSIENLHKHFVHCRISAGHEVLSLNEVKDTTLSLMMNFFPWQTWNGDFTYRLSSGSSMRWATFSMHWRQREIYAAWSD